MPYDPEQLPEKDKAQPTCSPGDDNELYILIAQCGSMTVVAPPGVPGKRADLLYVVIFCRLALRDDYLVSRLA